MLYNLFAPFNQLKFFLSAKCVHTFYPRFKALYKCDLLLRFNLVILRVKTYNLYFLRLWKTSLWALTVVIQGQSLNFFLCLNFLICKRVQWKIISLGFRIKQDNMTESTLFTVKCYTNLNYCFVRYSVNLLSGYTNMLRIMTIFQYWRLLRCILFQRCDLPSLM